MNLFQLGEFRLNSGLKTGWKIDCDALTDADIRILALMVCKLVGGVFGTVEGVPTGGLRLAEALKPFCMSGSQIHLIVDDVLTTGGSMERLWLKVPSSKPVVGAVIFARGRCPNWIYPLFQMPECLWTV